MGLPGGVHRLEADVAAALGAVPGQEEVIGVIVLHRRHLGIGVGLPVVGEHHQVAQGAVGFHRPVGQLVALIGGVFILGPPVQDEGHQSGAVGEHGGLDAGHGAGGAVVHHPGVFPAAAVIEAHIDGVPGVEVQQALALIPRVGGVDAAPEHRGIVAAHHGHRSQVGGGVEGEGAGRPARAVVRGDRRHDLGAVEQLLLLVGGEDVVLIHRSVGRVRRHLVGEPHPGGHGEVLSARQGGGHVAAAVFALVVGVVPVVNGLARCAHSPGVDPAVVEALAPLVADVDGQGAVVVHRRLGAGVGVVLHHIGGLVIGRAAAPPVGPAVGVGR